MGYRVSGKVQKVGFRYAVRDKALALGLTGYACNRADGTVDVLVSGDPSHIETFYAWLQRVPDPAQVECVEELAVADRLQWESDQGFGIL
jgi:acylphosphatase